MNETNKLIEVLKESGLNEAQAILFSENIQKTAELNGLSFLEHVEINDRVINVRVEVPIYNDDEKEYVIVALLNNEKSADNPKAVSLIKRDFKISNGNYRREIKRGIVADSFANNICDPIRKIMDEFLQKLKQSIFQSKVVDISKNGHQQSY